MIGKLLRAYRRIVRRVRLTELYMKRNGLTKKQAKIVARFYDKVREKNEDE
jgi:hypothetical protein